MSAPQRNYIGLTGGIGAGKSTAAARFVALGAAVLDADGISRRALEPDGCCYAETLELFGRGVLLPDGRIDRARVAALVFSDAALRARLNALVHPAVRREMLAQAARMGTGRLIVFDVPLLFESGWQAMVSRTVLVAAREETRIARVCRRDGCAPQAAAARIRAQMPQREKEALADFVLQNDGTLEALYRQVDALYARLAAEAGL